jgi:cysteine desulfurase
VGAAPAVVGTTPAAATRAGAAVVTAADRAATWHYLDHAASTPMRPEALATMVPLLTDTYGNPTGAHALARAARAELEAARERLAAAVGCRPGEVVFTGGGTEADNLAVRGVLEQRGGTAVCSAVEHHAVLHAVERAGGRVVPVGPDGVVDLDALAAALGPDVSIVSVMLVNNEVGVVQPLDAIAEVVRAHAPEALLHTDAAQALTWLDVARRAAPADLVTLASHKCGGPKGNGALVVRDGVRLAPQLVGGGQEHERRSGTQDVAGSAGFAVAAERAVLERGSLTPRVAAWRAQLVGSITSAVPDALDTGSRAQEVVPGIVNLCLPGVESEALLFLLEQEHGVLASAASSCASGAQDPSHVLAAMGIDRSVARGSLRLSMGWSTTQADVDAAARAVPDAVARLRAHARDGAPA